MCRSSPAVKRCGNCSALYQLFDGDPLHVCEEHIHFFVYTQSYICVKVTKDYRYDKPRHQIHTKKYCSLCKEDIPFYTNLTEEQELTLSVLLQQWVLDAI